MINLNHEKNFLKYNRNVYILFLIINKILVTKK